MESSQLSSINTTLFTTYVVAFLAMATATAFFFLELARTLTRWRTIVSISGLITFAAATHYYYMREYFLQTGETPTYFRYADWFITVPMLCLQFYLIIKKSGKLQGTSLLWKLLFSSLLMLVTGYMGEAVEPQNSLMWGIISSLAYLFIVYLVWFGEVAQAAKQTTERTAEAIRTLAWFVLVGWSIYPLGYILGTPSGFFGLTVDLDLNMNYIYNIGDVVNKVGFGLVIWGLTRED